MIISAIILENLTEFIGRFHPVLVHLPIGVLLLAAPYHLQLAFPYFGA
jgi:uncharacterized membrane protein